MSIKKAATFLYCCAVVIYLEVALKLTTVGYLDSRFIYVLLFCIPFACIVYIPTLVWEGKCGKRIFNLLIFALSFFFGAQAVYYTGMNEYLSISTINMGGAAFTNFGDQILLTVRDGLPYFLILMVPVPVTAILCAKGKIEPERAGANAPLLAASVSLTLNMVFVSLLGIGSVEEYSVYDAYYSENISTELSVHNLGILTTTRLELQHMIYDEAWQNMSEEDTREDIREWDEEKYNVSHIDPQAILELTEQGSREEALLEELLGRTPTEKNQYTGAFKDHNLIMICAEAFSPHLIDPELTPTLYRLSGEGFVFTNYYGSFESVTTDGEYAACLGMFPETSRWGTNSTFAESGENSLPFALGNMFSKAGASTYAYHNYLGEYYSRNITHPNMGYSCFKTLENGLDIATNHPTSDLEMMKASVEDYISSGDQFHAYYMTFSGHYQYDWNNDMSAKNRDKVEELPFSKEVKAYIACNLELEYALEYLVNRLEQEGIADKTVIVLTNDHYPYGLTDKQFHELAGEEIEMTFEKYKSSFICWKGGMENGVYVDKLCSTVDILPTLLNLFGFEYDSRFIVGRDVLSPEEGIAVLSDQSFIAEDFRFDAAKNKIITEDGCCPDEERIKQKKTMVRRMFSLSSDIFETDIYKYYCEYITQCE